MYSQPMSGQILCISLQTGRHTDRKSVYTSRMSSVGSQESNMFDSCDPIDDRFENSEFDCLHMTIGLHTDRHCVNALYRTYRVAALCTYNRPMMHFTREKIWASFGVPSSPHQTSQKNPNGKRPALASYNMD